MTKSDDPTVASRSTLGPTFETVFGRQAQCRHSAPGRVNLIGEHTDYNDGFVLPTAIPQRTMVELAPSDDDTVRAFAQDISLRTDALVNYKLGAESPAHKWTDYLQGITRILRTEGFVLRGFDVTIHSTVPMGSGLSSSAALEVSLFRALRDAFSLNLSDVEIARLCQRVENEFVGAHVGIMDPMACSLASLGTALFLDTRDLSTEMIPLPASLDLVVINSGVRHSNIGGGYNARRAECKQACALLGVGSLRDISIDELDHLRDLPEVLIRRARHVITENLRVLEAVQALKDDDTDSLGELFSASHQSMKDDYEVSVPEIDMLVELAEEHPAIVGARMTGGGFGGSIVALAQRGFGELAGRVILEKYQERTGQKGTLLVPGGSEAPAASAGSAFASGGPLSELHLSD